MNRGWWFRFLLMVFLIFMGAASLYPTFKGMDREADYFIKKRLSLGLDLQGGLHMTLGIDFPRAFRDQLRTIGQRIIKMSAEESPPAVVTLGDFRNGLNENDPVLRLNLQPGQRDTVYKVVKEDNSYTTRIVEDEGDHISIGISSVYRNDTHKEAVDRSIQVIRNRIDEFGVTEPVITSQGDDRIVVQLPGVADVDRAKSLIGQTAKLEFRIVNTEKPPGEVAALVQEIEKENEITYREGERFSDYVTAINEKARGQIPEGTIIAFGKQSGTVAAQVIRTPYLLNAEVQVSGEDLENAVVNVDPQNNRPYVGFSLKPGGALRMGKLTGENLGKSMAIVLDGLVASAPTIQGKITDNGQITLGTGNYDDILREAKDTAMVLRAGALPVQLEFQEQRVVGPSLGQDSIESASKASIIGAILVLVFILVYYQLSGGIATICLVLNIGFLLSLLVGFDATLTLPGIAGIALTVGMAVDGNIIVFERIREELNKGKTALQSVEAGFEKAFSTIIDANITTAAGGFFLLQFGTGPIRGFAVTLLVGIVTTIYTSFYCSRIFYEIYLEKFKGAKATTLSI